MIKNKILDIKIIFKPYLKLLKTDLKYFRFLNKFFFTKHQIVVFKNCSQKLFFKSIFKNNYQTNPKAWSFTIMYFSCFYFLNICLKRAENKAI